MEKNPYCYFTPVFSDYAKHISTLKTRYNYANDTEMTGNSSAAQQTNTVSFCVYKVVESFEISSFTLFCQSLRFDLH